MRFNSLPFLLLLPAVCLLHWLLPHRLRSGFLLGVSWLFYGSYDAYAALLLLGATVLSWLCARGMAQRPRLRRPLLVLALSGLLGMLALFKYGGFLARELGHPLPFRLLLPAGISFYTFQALGYVLDVYRGHCEAEGNFWAYALFLSFFPQLVAGPIERTDRLLPQLCSPRSFRPELLSQGGWLLLSGYFRKVVIADSLAPLVDRVFAAPSEAAGSEAALATVLFGVQIYCDFSGYTNIARGCAKLLGIDLCENFDRPYTAPDIRSFWRRWHMSLNRWFTDYVYLPLGGSRKGLARQCGNLLLVFLLSGMWHGAGWTFLLWGALHGSYQIASLLFRRAGGRLPPALSRCVTFLAVSFAWLFFRAESLSDALALLGSLGRGWGLPALSWQEWVRTAAVLMCLPQLERLPQLRRTWSDSTQALTIFALCTAIWVAWLAHLSTTGANAFLYFQF